MECPTWWRFFQCVKPESQGAEAFGFSGSFGEYFRAQRFGVVVFKGIMLAFSTMLIVGAFAGALLAVGRFRTFVPLYAIAGYFLCIHTFVHATVRYRHPLIPILAVFSVFLLGALWRRCQSHCRPPERLGPAAEEGAE